MRPIDAEILENTLQAAIVIQEGMAKLLDAEDDDGIQMELKAYREILKGVREQPTLYGKCEDCARNADNLANGTRCPIQEHYGLPKDGFCHLWKKRK